jgi:hypothetical protein
MRPPKYEIEVKDVYQLTTVGLITGLLTTGLAIQFSAMAWLGVALAAYLYAYAGYRPVWRLLVFALTTTAIGFIGEAGSALSNLGNWNQWTDPLLLLKTAVIWGGAEIAGVLLAVRTLLIPQRQLLRPAAFGGLVGLMVIGVFVAAVGWLLGSTLGMWMWHGFAQLRPETPISPRELPSFGPLSFGLITQAGCAALVGLAFWQNRGDIVSASVAERNRKPPFWPAYLLLLPGIVAITMGAHAETHFAHLLTERAPSAVAGWITKPRSFDQVFIMAAEQDFKPTYGFSLASDHRTQTIEYTLRQSSLDTSKPGANVGFTVTVSQYPNAAWASYDIRQLPSPACIQLYPGLIHKRTVSGEIILTCSFIDEPNFYWASNDTTIEISFNRTAVSEEVLKSYLDRYPASELPSIYDKLN